MIMLFHNYDIMSYDYLPPPLRSATCLRQHVTSGRGFLSLRGVHVRSTYSHVVAGPSGSLLGASWRPLGSFFGPLGDFFGPLPPSFSDSLPIFPSSAGSNHGRRRDQLPPGWRCAAVRPGGEITLHSSRYVAFGGLLWGLLEASWGLLGGL